MNVAVNFHNHSETTYYMHISVTVLVKYTAKASVFALSQHINVSYCGILSLLEAG